MRLAGRLSFALLMVAACSDSGGRRSSGTWRTVTETIGDTIVVRTLGESNDADARTLVEEVRIGTLDGPPEYTFGEVSALAPGTNGGVYVADAQSHMIRQYDATGTHLRSFGGNGAGPGEFDAANGMVVLADGRVALWDPTNGRVNVYSSSGEPVATWAFPTGSSRTYGRSMVFSDSAGSTYLKFTLPSSSTDPPRAGAAPPRREALYRFDREGVLRDTLRAPVWEDQPPQLTTVRMQGNQLMGSTTWYIPWNPWMAWTWSPLGYFVAGRTDRYAIDLLRPDGKVVRIARDIPQLAVDPEERASEEEQLTARVRLGNPGWKWTGPPIPRIQPYFNSVTAGLDGRIWVSVSQPSEKVAVADPETPAPGQPAPPKWRWRSRTVYDVFEPDGQYLGAVKVPLRTSIHTMRGNQLWGVVRDSLDVPYVTRFRVEPPF